MKFLEKHRPIKEDIEALDTDIDIYFGAEVKILPNASSPYSAEVAGEMGFQFAIGGPHIPFLDKWDEAEFVKLQHENHIATCADPLVEVLVHPWWFWKAEFEEKGFPWLTDMKFLPKSVTKELGCAAKETGTAIEINSSAIFANPSYSFAFKAEYVEYLALLAEEGPMFSLSSDSHDISLPAGVAMADAALGEAGISEERVWHPKMEPLHKRMSGS